MIYHECQPSNCIHHHPTDCNIKRIKSLTQTALERPIKTLVKKGGVGRGRAGRGGAGWGRAGQGGAGRGGAGRGGQGGDGSIC